jgi:glycosyltransferase involved in cell wall biosynthesis
MQASGVKSPLLFELKSAFYSGITSAGPFFLHLTDPPSLVPADISKHAPSARRSCQQLNDLPTTSVMRRVRAELVHRLNRRGMRRATKVIVMTEKIRKELQDLYGVESLVVRPGVPAKGFDRRTREGVSKPLRMLSVSRLEPNKRIDWILRALSAQNATGSRKKDWVFEIVGHGPAAEFLKKLAYDLGLADRTYFLGHVSDEELANAYARANLFVMPAIQGYGLPALEALNRGIPTIVHKDSGVSEILGNTPWAELVDGGNGSLAKAIGSMMNRLENDSLLDSKMPRLPTSSEWAKAVCGACGWLPSGMN